MKAQGTALVTGASRGIGRATALELARRGFDVVASMRDPADAGVLVEEGHGRIRVMRLDVTNPTTIAIPDTLRVLVNNAGTETDYLPVEHAPISEWRRVFETNLFGLVEVTRAAIPSLRRAGGGVICNITTASLPFPMPFFAIYRASKAAVAALGESLRAELAPFGIRLLEVLPGPVETDMLSGSDRMPEAIEHSGYEELARWAYRGRQGAGASSTPAKDAADSIVDAILDDDAPLRVGCDPLGSGLLEAVGAASDEQRMRGMLAGMADPKPGG